MADEDHAEPVFAAQLAQQDQDLGLNRNVEARNDFIGHDKGRFQRKRPRNTHPLPLPAG